MWTGAWPPAATGSGRGPPETSSRIARTQETVGGSGVSEANGVPRPHTPLTIRRRLRHRNSGCRLFEADFEVRRKMAIFMARNNDSEQYEKNHHLHHRRRRAIRADRLKGGCLHQCDCHQGGVGRRLLYGQLRG